MKKATRVPSSQIAASDAAIDVLQQIAPVLMQSGISVAEFCAVAKWVFVREAADALRRSKQRVSLSRIAITTGLTRADVSRLLAESRRPALNFLWQNQRSSRVLFGWNSDREYSLPNGRPMPLAFSDGNRNFSTLVRRYSGDIPPRAMLRELISSNSVVQRKDGLYLPRSRSSSSGALDQGLIRDFGTKVSALAGTLAKDISGRDHQDPSFNAMCLLECSGEAHAAFVRRNLNRRASAFSSAIQRYLLDSAGIKKKKASKRNRRTVGLVVAVIEQ